MQLNRGDAKVLLLCNSLIAVPALREMLFYKEVSAIIIPGRNKEVVETVKEFTEGTDAEIITVSRKDYNKKIMTAIAAHNPSAVLMMTFPYIIPEEILKLPAKGFINFHYGRLPEYRGPEPIFTQIAQQEKKPALTVHIATEGVDDGPVVLQETIAFNENDTYAALQHKLAESGAKLTGVLIKILSFGNMLPATPQDESKACYHSKPSAADLMIDWQKMDSFAIKALVNACNPWNKGCGMKISDQVIAVTEAEIVENTFPDTKPGIIMSIHPPNGLCVGTKDGKIIKINIVFHPHFGFISGDRLHVLQVKEGDMCG